MREPLGDGLDRLGRPLEPDVEPVRGGACALGAARDRLAALGALSECELGPLTAGGHLGELGVGLRTGGARRDRTVLCSGQLGAAGADVVARQLPACLERLALETLVQLRRLGLTLQRPQAGACLALNVERAIEVLLRAIELELRAAPALAVLAQPGRLLDQQPAVLRLGGDDRLHAALADDGVHLLAQARVGQHLEHVDQAALRPVEAVLALAAAVQPATDRDLAERQIDVALGVVEDQLDLGGRARLDAVAAGEDHVLHRLAADGQRRLLAHAPQHRVGDVRLARAVRADDDRHARRELQRRAIRE